MKSKYLLSFFRTITFSLSLVLVEFIIYDLVPQPLKKVWFLLPIMVYVSLSIIQKKNATLYIISASLDVDSILSFILLYSIILRESWTIWIKSHIAVCALFIFAFQFISLAFKQKPQVVNTPSDKTEEPMDLFNLFYLNTSKTHEIAMLLDNKIVKRIEHEHILEGSKQNEISFSTGATTVGSLGTSFLQSENNKKRVLENFDVKMTKSLLLQKIYKKAKEHHKSNDEYTVGELVLLKNIQLTQINMDDTLLLLNIIQDSKFKNQSTQDVEINIDKTIEKMLDDFSIDFEFNIDTDGNKQRTDNAPFIIQLPYKATENFENGYTFKDLQLGKLSLIGIYRGTIDFSECKNISSRFFEMINQSNSNPTSGNNNKMKQSTSTTRDNNDSFNLQPSTSNGKKHLVDVIAIIQELKIDKEEKE